MHGWKIFYPRVCEHVCYLYLALFLHLWNAEFLSNASENLHDETRHFAWHFGVDLVFLPFVISVLWSCECRCDNLCHTFACSSYVMWFPYQMISNFLIFRMMHIMDVVNEHEFSWNYLIDFWFDWDFSFWLVTFEL